jgi:single-stranded-DNA-specific exonuclease
LSRSRWNVLPLPPDITKFQNAGYSSILGRILYHRGLTEPARIQNFIDSDASLCGDPYLLPGMHQAVSRIYRAMLSGEKIAVFGDFDTDGVSATVLMVEGLALLGVQAVPYIPHRLNEGYGLKAASLEKLHREGITLVISVDCGISAVSAVEYAGKIGLDVVITDHHTPLKVIPETVAVIDPKLPGSEYPFPELAGVGVAFKLMQALLQSVGKEDQITRFLDLVALGTVADMVPLLGENRYFVKRGLEVLNASPRLGIRELMALTNLENGRIESENISWLLAPRLNAAGRLEHARLSYELLTTGSQDEARSLATVLNKKNAERQDLTSKATTMAKEQVSADTIGAILVAQHDEFHAGVCGLVASRLVDAFYRPAIVIRKGEELSVGSCRSIPEFDIISALDRYQSAVGGFTQFGGHAQAAGFTLPTANLPRFADYLAELAGKELAGLDLRPRIDIDAEVKLSELGGDLYPTIRKLVPFGQGNPAPSFVSRNVDILECRPMGNAGEHLRLKLKQGGVVWNAVGFGFGPDQPEIASRIDLVYNLEMDHFNGSSRLRLNILDIETGNEA